jgi:D-alanyl-D-alanine endopeptidase (penicillin-binding protein 7)
MNNHRVFIVISTCLVVIGVFASIHVIRSTDIHQSLPPLISSTTTLSSQDVSVSMQRDQSFVVASSTSKTTIPVQDRITAKAYLVGDIDTGTVYIEHNPSEVLPVASMSKLVTAIVSTDTLSPTTTVLITSSETDVATDTSHIGAGETFTSHELLYPLLLNSSNIAAEALASSTDRAHFLYLMSGYAQVVGASTAFFADPSGLSPNNVASPRDMFALAQYIYKYRPDIFELTRIQKISVATTTDHGAHVFFSIHPFVTDPRFVGGKTGHTDAAGDTMLTILHIANHNLAFIVLGAGNGERTHDTQLLIAQVADKL